MTPHPSNYKVAQSVQAGNPFQLTSVPWKEPSPGEVVVKVLACGVCHSDSMTKEGHTHLPRVAGHEIVGRIEQLGQGLQRFKVGDIVGSGWHGGHCGVCASCRKGDFITCSELVVNGVSRDGGYGEYVTLRSEALVAVPEGMDPAQVCPLMCAGVTTFNALRNADVRSGDVVAIQGIGGLGHLGIQFARQMGFKTVALSSGPSKEAFAKELGAHYYLDGSVVDQAAELMKLGGAKVILATAPNTKVIETLIHGLAPGGQLVCVAAPQGNLSVPVLPLIIARRSIVGWPSGTAQDSEETLKFAQQTEIKCRIEKFSLDSVNEAYETMITGHVRFRAVLCME